MPAYYTSSDEEHPVFHAWENCPTGSQIENKVRVLMDRDFCRDCAEMEYADQS